MPPKEQNPIADIASKFINSTNRNIFLTGKAGTGKTTFLKKVRDNTHKNAIVAAPTGIAAINAGGVTLHSLFQLPFGAFLPSNKIFDENIHTQINTPKSLISGIQINKTKRAMLEELELLIIDEVSMLRSDLLDAIDVVLRYVRKNKHSPFGGIQILFIGDLFQLPPVVKNTEWNYLKPYYPGIYFYNAWALRQNKPLYLELEKIYRQNDPAFVALLNNLRENVLTTENMQLLNKQYQPSFNPDQKDGFIHLTTHNRHAYDTNKQKINSLKGASYFFNAEIEGDFRDYMYPVEEQLELKKGAQVMFIKNDYSGDQRYYNGKIGTVCELNTDRIKVLFNDGTPSTLVDPYLWENKTYTLNKKKNEIEEKTVGTFKHYPLKLAWAITVHKSQGLTFKKAIIDVSRAFAPGQIYVALSRLTSLEGLVLTSQIRPSAIKSNEELKQFTAEKKRLEELAAELAAETNRFVTTSAFNTFNFTELLNSLTHHINSYTKDEKKSSKQQFKLWALEFLADFKTVKEVADKFLRQLTNIAQTKGPDFISFFHQRVQAARIYFEPLLIAFLKRIIDQIDKLSSVKKIKTYTNELRELERLFLRQLHYINKAEALLKSAMQRTELSKKQCPPLY